MKRVLMLLIVSLFLVSFIIAPSIEDYNAKAVSAESVSVSTDNPTQEQRCAEAGRTWREFSNGCVDSCEINRNPNDTSCTAALTMGCDCGETKCWNGKKCENIIDEEKDKVCCHKFGYGKEMEVVNSKYLMINKDDCKTPEDYVGGGREVVNNEKCEEYRKRIMVKKRIQANYQNKSECPNECTCSGSTVKCNLEGGRVMTITAGKSGNLIVQVKEVNMSTKVELYKNENGTIIGKFKGNKTREIKVLPDEVKEKLRQKIKARLEEHNITLDEDGIYQVQAKKRARLFFVFPVKERIRTHIDSETGDITRTRTSWWGFMARDVKEDTSAE